MTIINHMCFCFYHFFDAWLRTSLHIIVLGCKIWFKTSLLTYCFIVWSHKRKFNDYNPNPNPCIIIPLIPFLFTRTWCSDWWRNPRLEPLPNNLLAALHGPTTHIRLVEIWMVSPTIISIYITLVALINTRVVISATRVI